MRKLFVYLVFWRVLVADIMYATCNQKDKERLNQGLMRYAEKEAPYKKAGLRSLNYCLIFGNTFRNVFYFRIKGHALMKTISRFFIKPVSTVEIGGDTGGGLRINHMVAVVYPYSAGKNLTVGPNVVIGKGPKKDNGEINAPIIGHNVYILPNSVITGGIKLGNDVSVGAGTIVTKSVPNGCVVVGNPGRIIRSEE